MVKSPTDKLKRRFPRNHPSQNRCSCTARSVSRSLRGRAVALGDRFDALSGGESKDMWRDADKIPLSDPASYRELLN
jgi:hypothetical protein